VSGARFVACHQFDFVDKIDVLEHAAPGAVFLLNAAGDSSQVWDKLPREMQEQIIEKKIRFYAIDAMEVAKATGMGQRINTIMQTCYFAISGVLPREEAIYQIKKAIEKTYGKRGAEVVRRNFEAVDSTLAHLHEVPVPETVSSTRRRPPIVSAAAPDFVQKVTALMLAGKGDLLPVSAFPVDGTWPVATAKWEKRNIAIEIPGLGRENLHPVQPVRAGLPALGDPRQGVRSGGARRRAGDVQVHSIQGSRIQRPDLYYSGRAGGLHGLQPVRQCLSGQGPHQSQAQGDRHASAGARCGSRSGRTIPSSSICRRLRAGIWRGSITRARNSSSRCSSIPAPAPVVAKRRTSSC
jgi:Pyruvate/2-oxoacid:ferredoxin oxidoreductase gamma subunit